MEKKYKTRKFNREYLNFLYFATIKSSYAAVDLSPSSNDLQTSQAKNIRITVIWKRFPDFVNVENWRLVVVLHEGEPEKHGVK